MKLIDLFEATDEPVVLSMLRRVLDKGDDVFVHDCHPQEKLEFDPNCDKVEAVASDPIFAKYISLKLFDNPSTGNQLSTISVEVSAFEEAVMKKRPKTLKHDIWDLYIET